MQTCHTFAVVAVGDLG